MTFEIVDEPRVQPRLGVALWVVATLIGVPFGVLIMEEIATRKAKWMPMAFPAAVFVTQFFALAIAGRARPLLLFLGLALGLCAAFCLWEMIPRDVDAWLRYAVYGLFFGVAWAGALARNGKEAGLWMGLGTIAVAVGFWCGDEVFRATRESIDERDTRRLAASLGFAVPIAVATTPLIWSSLRGRGTSGPARTPTPTTGLGAPGGIALVLAGLYLFALGGSVAYGAVQAEQASEKPAHEFRLRPRAEAYPGDALDLGALNWVLAAACIVVGAGLLARLDVARYAFHVAAPLGALAFASVFARDYWTADLPETIFFGLAAAVFVFFLARQPAVAATRRGLRGRTRAGARGVPWAIGLFAVVVLAYFIVKSNRPTRGGGFGARGFASHLEALNLHVKHLAVTYVFFWHAVPGLLAAAIPWFVDRASDDAESQEAVFEIVDDSGNERPARSED